MEKRTVFDRVECPSEGAIGVRLRKVVIDGDKEIATEYHRTVIVDGVSVGDQMEAVNRHLHVLGYPPVDDDTVRRIRKIVEAAR